MTTVKLFSPEDWSNLNAEQHQIKVASTGIKSGDAQDAAKFASAEILHLLKNVDLDPDCFYVHKLAMGGSHRYGPNRWGDGFREEVLENDVHTFPKFAKAYRQHKSKGPYFGSVKVARLRGDGIVELVTEYYGTEKKASAEGGEVADKEIESLLKRGSIPVSMGSLVPGDSCSQCGHWAPKPKDRCMSKKEGGSCTLFGCKTGMLKMASDGRINYVDNPVNTFYDISMVRVGADPIANGILLPVGDFYDQMHNNQKVAEFLLDQVPDIEFSDSERKSLSLLHKLADIQAKIRLDDEDSEFDLGFSKLATLDISTVKNLQSNNRQLVQNGLFSALRSGHLSDFNTFAKAAGLSDLEIKSASGYIPTVYDRARIVGCDHKIIKIAENYKNLIVNSASKVASLDMNDVNLKKIMRDSFIEQSSGRKLIPVLQPELSSSVPEVVIKYAGLQLALASLKDFDPIYLYGILRKENYLAQPI